MDESLDLATVERDLTRNACEQPGSLSWLVRSYEEPRVFWSLLMGAYSKLTSQPPKSKAFARYDFFHDIIVRHQKNPEPAFRWHDEFEGWKAMSYAELGSLAGQRAAAWTGLGASPGQKLLILSPLCHQAVVALLAALKIGLIVSLLPPEGRSFLRNRIEALSPDYIWTEELYAPLIAEFRQLILPEVKASGDKEPGYRSHAYGSGEPFALCFDPSAQEPHIPRELGTDAAYLCSVRDGLIALSLKPGQGFASPGFDLLQTQPALLLACLLTGATYVHLTPKDIEKNPELLVHYPLKIVGVSAPIREVLLRKPLDVSKAWLSWFRDPGELQDLPLWTEFVEAVSLKEIPAGCLRWNSSLGGCLLFSLRRRGVAHLQVLPSAGAPWHLADPADPKRISAYDHGLFAQCCPGAEQNDPVVCAGILAGSRREWLYLRPVLTGRRGRVYPAQEVLDVLMERDFAFPASVVELPASGSASSSSFVLLLFAGAKKVSEAAVTEHVKKEIVRELGTELLPDRIEIVHLHPRRTEDGSIDHAWCAGQYLSGGLSRRQRGEIFQYITELREQF